MSAVNFGNSVPQPVPQNRADYSTQRRTHKDTESARTMIFQSILRTAPDRGGRQVLGHAVREIILRRIAGEIGERQHHDRKMPGLRGFFRALAEEKPAAGGGQKQKGGNCCGKRTRTQWPLGRQRLCRSRHRPRRLRLRRLTDLERIGPHRLGDILELGRAEIADREIEPST